MAAPLNYLGGVQILGFRPLRALGLLTGALLLTLAVIGCTGNGPTPKTVAVDVSYDDLLNQKHVQRGVELHVGDTLQVTLGSNATTGYRWETDAQISDNGIVRQTTQEAIPPANGMPGAPGGQKWTFTALKAGKASIATTYGQPWPGGEQNAWTFTADVTVSD
jgi:inhibitor of cysteine peptidase